MTRPMAAVAVPPEATPDVVAGIDLGSNSFHMIVVRAQKDGRVHILDRIKEPVRLADGLTKGRELDGDAQARGLDALNRFSQRLASFPRASVRAVGTNTLRMAKNGPEFLLRARESLGHDIDIISGPEEARLIYLGVSHSSWFPGPRLVMDVGGGSTELIVGEGYTADLRDSLFMGCVSYSKRFFERGRLREEGFDAAEVAAKLELRGIAKRYQAHGWERATGASGTLKAIDTVIREEGWSQEGITKPGLDRLREHLIEARKVDRVELRGLEEHRAEVFAGGVAIVRATFDILNISVMDVSDGALREGVAYELLGRSAQGDVRDATVDAVVERYRADRDHGRRVEDTCLDLYEQLQKPWKMRDERSRKFIHWASALHEIGLSIAYSGHHKHAAYVVRNAEMPGFSREQQTMLAAILENQRRRLRPKRFERLAPDRQELALQLSVIVRLSILLNRERTDEAQPSVEVTRASRRRLDLRFPEGWLDGRPMTRADLEEEASYLDKIDIELAFE